MRADHLVRPAARARGRVGARRGAGARRRAPSRAADRPARHRRIVADLGRERPARPRSRRRRTFHRPTCRRATPSSCRWRSAGPRCSRRRDIVIGVNALDYSGYPDCRPEFIRAFESLATLATRAGVEGARFRIHTPLIDLTKAEIIRRGLALGLDYGLTHSCYDPQSDGRPCGRCDSCALRARGFAEAGVADPLLLR